MGQYTICNDYLELIAGTSNTITQAYKEAADNVDKNNKMGLSYLKNFITSIENIANKEGVKDKRISETRGNLKKFTGYDNIKFAIEFIQKNLAGAPGLRDMVAIHDKLIEFQPKYSDAYDKNVRLAILEYESGVYLLTTGLSMLLANNMEVIQNGVNIKIQKTNESTHGIIDKTIKDFSAQITSKDHGVYLDELIKATENAPTTAAIGESTFMEDTVADTVNIINGIIGSVRKLVGLGVNAVKSVKRSIFGIVPLIRSAMYLKYKKKADTINSLDEQCAFIHRNIEQLQNMKNIDPEKKAEIIKKQQATIEAYQKKAAKLRAQLMEAEKEAATAIEKENPELKKADDDFVLEGVSISKIFTEGNE